MASLEPYQTEDEIDAAVAQRRLDELEDNPTKLLRGDELARRLATLEAE